ncbi:hypothetical protein JG687_00013499 [Phytophthora cactorum]|uniref:Probable pectate lyase F n=1 Tax=Phytophthora cactorum TaxID=29920 RepID=A0A8T1U1R4_9STRA|nr:hypothetical protein PC123_g18714 [Phytophthora cactorum]KAG6951617.1 hypothetical protein JG687_00013499 [Phytophthora cactorum]
MARCRPASARISRVSSGGDQKDTSVLLVEAGGTLKSAIIGKNQKEGVHCDNHDCTIENVEWDDVCEGTLSVKGGSVTRGFFAQEFGKLHSLCGTCGNPPRKVTVETMYTIVPLVSVVTVNKNSNDQATLRNIHVKTADVKKNVKVASQQDAVDPWQLAVGLALPVLVE